MHAPKVVKTVMVGAAVAASVALVGPAAHADAPDPGKSKKVGYVASFRSKNDCIAGGAMGKKRQYWGAFHCVEQGKYWHLLIDMDQLNRAKIEADRKKNK